MEITIPDKVRTIIGRLMDEGYEAYVVGGCVRDSILGRTPNDWDITTNAKPLDVKKLFRRTIDVGIEHGTVKVMLGDEGYEITTYRIDGSYMDSRHPSSVEFTSLLSEDLKRRDFTINAMAYNDNEGIVDLFDGIGDIDKKLIRAVGDPRQRFGEDALRILRAVRFSAQLGYEIEDETKSAIKELAPTLKNISAERIREELEKLIMSDNPDRLRMLYDLNISKVIIPEWDEMTECEQNSLHHYLSVSEHTIYALNDCVKHDRDLDERSRRLLRLTIFLHDVAKPVKKFVGPDNLDHFKGHPEEGAKMAVSILRRLKYDNATIRDVEALVRYHDERPSLSYPKLRKFMIDVGPERISLLTRVKWIDLWAHSNYQMEEKTAYTKEFEEKTKKILADKDCLSIKDLALKGQDLMELGIKSGPLMGEALNRLLDYVIEYPHKNNKEELLKYAKGFINEI